MKTPSKVETKSDYSLWKIAGIEIATLISIAFCSVGITLSSQMKFYDAILAFLAAQAIVALAISLTAYIGAKTGRNTAGLLTEVFGAHANKFISGIIAFCLLAWFAFQIEIFATSIKYILQKSTHFNLSTSLIIIFSGLLMGSTAIKGVRGLEALSRICTPFLGLTLIANAIFLCLNKGINFEVFQNNSEAKISMGAAITALAGGISLGILTAPNISRHARSPAHAVSGMILSHFFSSFLIFSLISIIAAGHGYQSESFAELLLKVSGSSLTILFLVMATWTTNDTNIFLCTEALSSLWNAPRWKITSLSILVGISFALIGVLQNFMSLISFLGIIFTPVTITLILDYFCSAKKIQKQASNDFKKINYVPVFSSIIGTVIGIITTKQAQSGFELIELTGTPVCDAVLATMISYFLLRLIFKRKSC